ncbi:MAG: hypothetical protein K5769_07060 [Pseudobutyrivibrio sp.]|nr:hypothetical protein [Pseudobutyrivibrio sp.]
MAFIDETLAAEISAQLTEILKQYPHVLEEILKELNLKNDSKDNIYSSEQYSYETIAKNIIDNNNSEESIKKINGVLEKYVRPFSQEEFDSICDFLKENGLGEEYIMSLVDSLEQKEKNYEDDIKKLTNRKNKYSSDIAKQRQAIKAELKDIDTKIAEIEKNKNPNLDDDESDELNKKLDELNGKKENLERALNNKDERLKKANEVIVNKKNELECIKNEIRKLRGIDYELKKNDGYKIIKEQNKFDSQFGFVENNNPFGKKNVNETFPIATDLLHQNTAPNNIPPIETSSNEKKEPSKTVFTIGETTFEFNDDVSYTDYPDKNGRVTRVLNDKKGNPLGSIKYEGSKIKSIDLKGPGTIAIYKNGRCIFSQKLEAGEKLHMKMGKKGPKDVSISNSQGEKKEYNVDNAGNIHEKMSLPMADPRQNNVLPGPFGNKPYKGKSFSSPISSEQTSSLNQTPSISSPSPI